MWWCAVGENVGVEIDGKSEKYSRPVIVLKKHTNRCFTGVPLTSQPLSKQDYNKVLRSYIRFIKNKNMP